MAAEAATQSVAEPDSAGPRGLVAWEHERFERVTAGLDLGPAKGGIRFRPGVELDDVTALARLMTWKTALHGLPFGGAKRGVDCDPSAFSARELHEVTRLYTLAVLAVIGRIVGLRDITGTITNDLGLDPAAIRGWITSGGDLVDYPDADAVDGSVLVVDCDIAISAALEGTVTEDVASRLSAKLVVEGANGPTTPAAERKLNDRGVAVVPDLMANAGGVISSYYEWAENHQRVSWTEADERRLVLERPPRAAQLARSSPRRCDRPGHGRDGARRPGLGSAPSRRRPSAECRSLMFGASHTRCGT